MLPLWCASFALVLSGARPRLQRTRASAPASAIAGDNPVVTELLSAVLPRRSASERSSAERSRIQTLIKSLEVLGKDESYLSDAKYISQRSGGSSLWDNYEVAYFDSSIDGGRGNATAAKGRKSILASVLGALFSLRFSLQIVKPPAAVINFVGVRILGVPATITALGKYEPLNATAIAAARTAFGTQLREGTSIRITFGPPRLAFFGSSPCGFSFELGGSAVQPPVDLCITYLDERLRLGLAARGVRFVFTRGGVAAMPFANEWETILARRPVGWREVKLVGLLALVAVLIRRCAPTWLPWHLGFPYTL